MKYSRLSRLGLSAVSAVSVAVLAAASTASAETYAIQAGHLIVDAAKPAHGASTVVVENGRIARIEDGFTAPAGATVVDERNRTVMPCCRSRGTSSRTRSASLHTKHRYSSGSTGRCRSSLSSLCTPQLTHRCALSSRYARTLSRSASNHSGSSGETTRPRNTE